MQKTIIISANVLFTIVNFRKELIKELIQQNFTVVCVSDEDTLSQNSQINLHTLGIVYEKVSVSRKGLNPYEDVLYFLALYTLYKKYNPLVVLHFTIKPNIYGTLAAKFAGVASINTINGLGSALIADNFLSKVLKMMYTVALRYSTRLFFQNQSDKMFFEAHKIIEHGISSIVPGSGVCVKEFTKNKTLHTQRTFLLIARLLKDKGIYEYIQAIKIVKKEYPDVVFLLAGPYDNGNPTAIQEKEVQEWHKQNLIQYLGQTEDIREFFTLCDIVVLPSYREGLSRVLIEAASAYKPLIASDVAGCRDVVQDGYNGFLCQAKDAHSLAKSMIQMIVSSKNELYALGIHSREIAERNFDKEKVNKIYLDAIGMIDKES